MPATARLIVMMEESEKATLEAQAEAAKISTAEFVRRRLFGRTEGEERAFLQMLADLRPLVRKAARTIDANLAAIRALGQDRRERDAELEDAARLELTGDELTSLAERLHLRRPTAPRTARRGART